MTESNHDRGLERRIAATLDAGCARVDANVVQRLDRARREALEQVPPTPRVWWFGPALAASSLTLVALVAVLRSPAEPATAPMTADLDLLTRPEFEVFLEDSDFFAWVAEMDMPDEPQPGTNEEQSG